MGYNTVAVLYNDMISDIRDSANVGPRIAYAMRAFTWPDSHREAHFGYGQIVSQAHADHDQIVIVGQNRGRPLHECTDLALLTQEQLADALRLHGWTVKPPRKSRANPQSAKEASHG